MTDAVLSHLSSLNLTGNPFPPSPDAGNHFVSDALAVSMVEILHTIKARKGFILVTGEVGVGKSTLSRRLMNELHEESVETALILNTFLQGESLLAAINEDFGICEKGKNIHECLKLLNAFLLKCHADGINCVVMIDDAQNLDPVSLELVRQLSNLETGQDKLVQILLISQPEIMDVLNRHDLRQLKSRIALHVQLMDFSLQESFQYITFRLKRFGGGITLTRRALNLLHKASQGYPRLINKVMDRCLYGLVASNRREIAASLMQASIDELQLGTNKGLKMFKSLSIATVICMAALAAVFWWVEQISSDKPTPVLSVAGWHLINTREMSSPVRDDLKGVDKSSTAMNSQSLNKLPSSKAITRSHQSLSSKVNQVITTHEAEAAIVAQDQVAIVSAASVESDIKPEPSTSNMPVTKAQVFDAETTIPLAQPQTASVKADAVESDAESEVTISNLPVAQPQVSDIEAVPVAQAQTSRVEASAIERGAESEVTISNLPVAQPQVSDAVAQAQTASVKADAAESVVKSEITTSNLPVTQPQMSEIMNMPATPASTETVSNKKVSAAEKIISNQSLTSDKSEVKAISKEERSKTAILMAQNWRFGHQSIYTKHVQTLLHQMGYYTAKLDGIVGVKTIVALTLFQQSQGLPATGYPSFDTMAAVIDIAGVPRISDIEDEVAVK